MKLVFAILFFCTTLAGQTGPDWVWATQGGGTGEDCGMSIAVDAAGDNYVAGYFTGTATFGDSTWTSYSDYYDLFVGRIDPLGNWLWAVRAGGDNMDQANGITLDSAGNIYVCGSFTGTVDFGTNTLVSSGTTPRGDVFVARLSPLGIWDWAVSAGGIYFDSAWGICSPDGLSLRVTGDYKGPATFGSANLTGNTNNVFVASLDLNGNWLWARQGGGSAADQGFGIIGDAAGNCWVTGRYGSFGFFGSITLTSNGNNDIFVAKLDGSGNWLWASGAGGSTAFDSGNCVACDPDGNCYVTGSYGGTAVFGTELSLTATEGKDIFIAKLSPLGDWTWVLGTGGGYFDSGNAIVGDGAGNYCVTGYYSGTTVFGTDILSSGSDTDLFVCAVSMSGEWQWAVNTGSASELAGLGITSINGELIITGSYVNGAAQFGGFVLPVPSNSDMFIARLGELTPSGIPDQPRNMLISISGDIVTISWDAVTLDTHGFPVTVHHYDVYRTSDPGGLYDSMGTTFDSVWTGSASAHQRHFYFVKAVTQ